MTDGPHNDSVRLRLLQEVVDTRQRIALGGAFYLVGWLVVAGFGGVFTRAPLPAAAVAAAFVLLAVLRVVVLLPSGDADARTLQRWLDRVWAVVLLTAALWGGVLAWTLLTPAMVPARDAALLCTIAYATAFAHNFSLRRGRALLGIVLIHAPAPLLLAADPDERAAAITLAIYSLYLLLTLQRSHDEYQRQLDVDDELREQRDAYEQLSRTDALTGLANRRHFGIALDQRSFEARRDQTPLSLLVLDLDHFKLINDRHGHDAGDACLARFGERLQQHFPPQPGHIARLGGEEFAVLLPGFAPAAAAAAADALRASLASTPLQLREGPIALSVSIGVAGLDAGGAQDGADLYRAADRAMYRAKADGRDRVRVDGT